jgi:hypothetical protein
MAVNGGEIARNHPQRLHKELIRIPLRAASACSLGSQKMANKTVITIDVTFDVAATIRWICLAVTVLLA